MMRSPQGISLNGWGTSSTQPATRSRAVKILSLSLALLMLCTTTIFVTARVTHLPVRLIAGNVVLPIALGNHAFAGVVLGDHPRPAGTGGAITVHSHLDPHRRMPAAVEAPRVAARALPYQQAGGTLATDGSQARYGHGRQDRQNAGGQQVVTIAR